MRNFSTESALDFADTINEQVNDFVSESTERVSADKLGLDIRCGRLYVNSDAVIVDKDSDRSLQYYGGFEYVDKEFRVEIGDYVFYMRDDSRVSECLEAYEELAEEDAE